jgi:hypothetical protein
LTFQGLWVEADSAGRGVADPRILKGSIWPLRDEIAPETIAEHLRELEREHIVLYEVDGEPYYLVRNWEKHQSAAYRTGEPVHPAPPCDGSCTTSCASCTDNVALRELKGREGNAHEPVASAEPTTPPTGVKPAPTEPDDFDSFWSIYPRKKDRASAVKAWRRLNRADRAAALQALPLHAAAWKREHPDTDQFVPFGATWLNKRRWEDEIRSRPAGAVVSKGVRVTGANAV